MVGVTAPALKKSTSTTGGGPLGIGDLQNGKDRFSLGGAECGQSTRENGTDWMRTQEKQEKRQKNLSHEEWEGRKDNGNLLEELG
ncbi:hypothetical protein RUM43_007167 [Polyplax serrata]|uniref:Uncharacterized protein n=1 Tax=Polyplax serrata TaxID=468196 RepID=A0AAN8S7P6_POLSC